MKTPTRDFVAKPTVRSRLNARARSLHVPRSELLRQAIERVVRDRTIRKPEKRTERIAAIIPDDLYESLKARAATLGIDPSHAIEIGLGLEEADFVAETIAKKEASK